MPRLICPALLLVPLLAGIAGAAGAEEREDPFEAKIRPVLAGTCFGCHGDSKTSGGLRVDSRDRLLAGGESGAAIVPGRPEESLLIQAIRREAHVSAMPPEEEQALRPDQVADFVAWVTAGAVWPAASAKFEAAKHWAFEPIRDVATPEVQDRSWAKTGIDRFVRARQEAAGAHPAPAADKLALLRRATFDLTGLPPTPEEVEAFLQDDSPQAFEAVVERLLASPAYGERWGRHWLDVVRYADTAGETADYPVPLAWRYRNYVIDAFNADKPYDEFLREQLAGDVLAGQGPRERYAERVTATGYLAISRRFGFDSENYHHLTIQDTLDTLGQSVLGLSLGCARCHDHKFDPLSMHDYYALYGIFDSSRYAFPGSEQKQRVRSLAPLAPPSEAQVQWRDYETQVAALAGHLARRQQPAPTAVLRSLSDIDGDFELQAPAAGGSNGVLVPPWLYQGKIAVTTAAQSPFQNLHPLGKVGASVPADAGAYRIQQALYPRRTAENGDRVYIGLDFRIAAPNSATQGAHRLMLGELGAAPAVEVLISSESVSLRAGETLDHLGSLAPGQWHHLQLILDLNSRTVAGSVGTPAATTDFSGQSFSPTWTGVIDAVELSAADPGNTHLPTIEFDNLGIQETPIPGVSTELPHSSVAALGLDSAALSDRLRAIVGIDGDFELQTADNPPASPWNPGPQSVVKVAAESQSPFQNVYGPGELGMHMPNRGEYDGFGLTLPGMKPDQEGRLYVGFDFRCASQAAGGGGSWRYYLGHGPGQSAAVELFFHGSEFFRRSADAREAVAPLAIGQWYQVQLTLDLHAKTYTGVLASPATEVEFHGQLATGWDGTIDYSFIDSYGHLGGVRPALDADNFAFGDRPLPPLEAPAVAVAAGSREARRAEVAELRRQLADLEANAIKSQAELDALLVQGPIPLTYGMSEGTPHNVRMHLRGEPDRLGEEVPRGFLRVLGGGPLPPQTAGSGRLELAHWLTRPDNPLPARVMVNRLWQYHFGRGLVKSPNDFGLRGLAPTHPELLDYLAAQFIRSGWTVKAMHRAIMGSATYQQASPANGGTDALDLYASFPRRRLGAEEIRDAVLAVSGELNRTPAQGHPFPSPTSWGFTQHNPFSAVYDHNHRSIYLMTQRLKRHPFLALFDGADPNATTAERLGTTVPTQALYFLNDPFIHAKSERWAERLLAAGGDDASRIDLAWRRACGRGPTEVELAEATEFLAAYRAEMTAANLDALEVRSLAAYLRTLLGSNEFLYVD